MPLSRKTPLRRTAFKRRRGPIKASPKTLEKRIREKMLDDLCREVTFLRDRHTCVRCGRGLLDLNKFGKPTVLHWAHVITRRIRRTRWRLENVMTLCEGCHFGFWHRAKIRMQDWPDQKAMEWFEMKFTDRYAMLRLMQNDRSPLPDATLVRMYLEHERRRLAA